MRNVSYTFALCLSVLLSCGYAFAEGEPVSGLDPALVSSYPLLDNQGFVVEYDAERRIPKWVYESISIDDISGDLDRGNTSSHMKADDRLDSKHQAESDDYKYTGLDRGHMAAAGNHKSKVETRESTFLMTNICPQNPSLNRYYWSRIEDSTRNLLATADRVHIITGPLFLPKKAEDGKWYVSYQVIGENAEEEPVAVPTHFFKIIIAEHDSWCEHYGLIVPNEKIPKSTPYDDFAAPISKIERAAGFVLSELLRDRLHINKELVRSF